MPVEVELLEGKGDSLEAARAQAIDWLGEHARGFGVNWDLQEFALRAVRDGELIGTLIGSTNISWLHVTLLAVSPAERKGGVGGTLLRRAEEIGRARGCVGAGLDTFDFQAPAFYPRFGYEEVGRIENMPPGHCRLFFRKHL